MTWRILLLAVPLLMGSVEAQLVSTSERTSDPACMSKSPLFPRTHAQRTHVDDVYVKESTTQNTFTQMNVRKTEANHGFIPTCIHMYCMVQNIII